MPLLANVTVASFAPADGKAQHPFRMVVRWRDSGLFQKNPQRVNLPQESGGKFTGIIFFPMIPGNQFYESGIEGPPLPFCWWRMGHMTQSAQFRQRICAEFGDFFVFTFGKLFGLANKVRQARLSQSDPFRVKPITVADKDAIPLFYRAP